MTYSQCPFEPVVTGRDAQSAVMYRLLRWSLRRNWRSMSAAYDKAVEDAVVKGMGYWQVVMKENDE